MIDQEQAGPGAVESPLQSLICAVIVTYNIGKEIHRCFNSIRGQVGHILIIDNASDEVTRQELATLAPCDATTLILNERNEGIAHAFNQAVQWARSNAFQWILTLDHDSEATPGMVDKLASTYAALERHGIQNVGVIGANPFDQNTQVFRQYRPRDEGGMPLEEEEVISSGSLIPLRVIDVVGPFNEDLFIYCVDTEFCMRLVRHGFRVYVCTEAVLLHREGFRRRHRFLWRHAIHDHYGKVARYYIARNTIHMLKQHPLDLAEIYWLVRWNLKIHVKVLLYDQDCFAILWFSLRGFIDGFRGTIGPLSLEDPSAQHTD